MSLPRSGVLQIWPATFAASVTLLALELVVLIVLFAADDAINHRGSVATWGTSFQVIFAAAVAVVLATLLQVLARAGL